MSTNPITAAVARVTATLADLTPEKTASVEESATLTTSEWLALGDKSTRAYASGLCDLDTANALHGIHSRFNGSATLAERVVFLPAMSELLGRLA